MISMDFAIRLDIHRMPINRTTNDSQNVHLLSKFNENSTDIQTCSSTIARRYFEDPNELYNHTDGTVKF